MPFSGLVTKNIKNPQSLSFSTNNFISLYFPRVHGIVSQKVELDEPFYTNCLMKDFYTPKTSDTKVN